MLSSRMRIAVMCFKLTSPFPRGVGSKGCPPMQTDCTGRASGHFSKALATQKYSQLLYLSVLVAKSVCAAPREV